MEKHCESVKRFGKEGNGWHRGDIVREAREFLLCGGNEARRELVRTTLELDRLLREVRS
ncbi:MAG: hypothetical protein WCU88_08915 [Elusimicrobiota bacterium]|jgi:hypothetical protein